MRYASLRAVLCIFVIATLGALGCASGEELEPIGECESNVDCGANETCNLASNTCEPLRTTNNSQNSSTPTNLGNTDDPDGDFTPGTDAGMPDMDDSCEPACASDEVCVSGACQSACPEGCAANQMCTSQGCVFPNCAAEGDPCNPEMGDQGQFLCLQDTDGNGTCSVACEDAFEVSNCGVGQYCFEVSDDGQFKACLDSTCDSSVECTDGTCINFENDFGTCVTSGSLALGETCNVGMGDSCVGGAFCRVTDSTAGSGVCAAICDPWAPTSDCPGGQACGSFLTWRTGLCTADVDPIGTDAFDRCSVPTSSCDDGVRCLALATDNICLQYCRPGENDCVGILPDGSDGRCNNYAFYGNRVVGLCLGACSSDGDCGAGGRCVNSICRNSCSVAADCCADPTNCAAECVNGLCE